MGPEVCNRMFGLRIDHISSDSWSLYGFIITVYSDNESAKPSMNLWLQWPHAAPAKTVLTVTRARLIKIR